MSQKKIRSRKDEDVTGNKCVPVFFYCSIVGKNMYIHYGREAKWNILLLQ